MTSSWRGGSGWPKIAALALAAAEHFTEPARTQLSAFSRKNLLMRWQ
jgi:hypothetical protein